jgi:Ca-activated chloride channel family protein
MQGKLPPQEDVRVEEFVNYFKQDYPADPKTAFSVFSDGGPAPFGDGVELLKVTVKARELRPGERKGVILTFCLDTSGSMILDNRLELVRSALTALLDSLGPDDRVGVVAYNDQAYLALPHAPAREKERILGALETLVPAGGSNVEAGLELAYQLADDVFEPRAMNRVVLCSDGVATAGARGPEEILKKIKVYAQRGVYLSSVGFGRQRYDDKMMERLANEGNGRYDFVSNVSEARRIFQANLPAMLQVLAQDAKIQVEFNPDVVSHYRLLGYENRDIKDTQFRDDTVDAGEVGPGTTVTALYEVQSHARAHGPLGRVFVRFRDPTTRNVDELNFPLVPGVLVPEATATSDLFRFIACAAETAELLRGSYWARNGSYTKIMKVLMGLSPEFRSTPEWSELVTVVRQAQAITFQNLLRQ